MKTTPYLPGMQLKRARAKVEKKSKDEGAAGLRSLFGKWLDFSPLKSKRKRVYGLHAVPPANPRRLLVRRRSRSPVCVEGGEREGSSECQHRRLLPSANEAGTRRAEGSRKEPCPEDVRQGENIRFNGV